MDLVVMLVYCEGLLAVLVKSMSSRFLLEQFLSL